MKLSTFGQKLGADAGINSLMDDLGEAMASGDEVIMMGGGNPGYLPAVTDRLQAIAKQLVDDP